MTRSSRAITKLVSRLNSGLGARCLLRPSREALCAALLIRRSHASVHALGGMRESGGERPRSARPKMGPRSRTPRAAHMRQHRPH
eukprot:CAMPEP_0183357984 /NCGR_PEP_ID=MMETSP0164_2-20130417/47900_1 /TAXON_ID=221442 /ORGANISM="Coccolithus pelagicus ssp braarudi, Strain PLY182g" /LENGTH=84 /DNA_ID=CAMNT_0025531769 /DNA_START=104 /DNA_END=355 /DNA_ORIENTATION=+